MLLWEVELAEVEWERTPPSRVTAVLAGVPQGAEAVETVGEQNAGRLDYLAVVFSVCLLLFVGVRMA